MTFVLRDRPDGQVEIIVERPVLVGIFPERDTAEKVRAFLQADADEIDEEPPLFSHDRPSVGAASEEPLDLVAEIEAAGVDQNVVSVTQDPKARRVRQTTANLPAVVPDQPTPTALIVHTPPEILTEAQIASAFARLEDGEKLAIVAVDLGISFHRLRGMWAQNRRMVQKHLAEGGQVPCRMCKTPFIPSLSNPETCARCSHE